MKKVLKFIKNTEGQALVESALVIFFVLIPLILGMVEFGWILNGQITLTSTAREGARAAIVCENNDNDKALNAAISAAVNSAANSSLTNVTIPNDINHFNFDLSSNKTVTLKVTATIHPIVGLFLTSNVNLTATAKMRIE